MLVSSCTVLASWAYNDKEEEGGGGHCDFLGLMLFQTGQ